MANEKLPLIKVSGSPYQRGLQCGRQCGDLIRRYPAVLLEAMQLEAQWRALDTSRPALKRDELLTRAMHFLPALEAFAPHLVEELRGIADGAKMLLAEVLLVNVRAEVMGLDASHVTSHDDLCTAFAVGRHGTADGSILAGQNLDQHPANRDLLVMLHVEPDSGPAILMCTFAGLIGYPGVNSARVSLFQNALSNKNWRKDGMPHYFLKRVLLEQTSIADCLAVALRSKVCSSANYLLTDQSGALMDLELAPFSLATVEPHDDILVHTNHFQDPRLASDDILLPDIPDSVFRAERMSTLIRRRRGHLTVADLEALLRDHNNAPTSICRHQPNFVTIAALIAEPDQGRLHVAWGNPCENTFAAYSL